MLEILEKNNIIILKSSYTHIDIQQKLINEGYPQNDIHSITRIFEKAMYSDQPIKGHNLEDFMVSIRNLFSEKRRAKG